MTNINQKLEEHEEKISKLESRAEWFNKRILDAKEYSFKEGSEFIKALWKREIDKLLKEHRIMIPAWKLKFVLQKLNK
jgi:hypothetical protein